MINHNCRWPWLVVFGIAIIAVFATASRAAGNNILLLLNDVGEILKIDVDAGKILDKTYIPETYYSNKIFADPKGEYIMVGGGAHLALFLKPDSLLIKGILKPEIPKLPWEKNNDDIYKERLSGFASVYGGEWAVIPDGNKVYFSGGVPQLKPTIVIDPFTYEIKKKIKEFVIYPDTIFSADGKFMLINYRKTKEILVVVVQADQIIKHIKASSNQDEFRGDLLYFDRVSKRLLVEYFSASGGGYCLLWVDTDSGKITRILNDPYEGKWGDCAISDSGSYLVYNEYVLQPSGPNQAESLYTGKIKIVDLENMSRKSLSLREQYPPDKWNLASKCYIVPDQETMLLAIKKKVDINLPGPTYWNPKLRHRKLLQPVHLLVVDLRRATIENTIVLSEGGFKDCAFLPRDVRRPQGGRAVAAFFPPMTMLTQEELKPLLEEWDKAVESDRLQEKGKAIMKVANYVPGNMRFRGSYVLRYSNPEIKDRIVDLYLRECAKANQPSPVDGRSETNPWHSGDGEYMIFLMTMAESTFDPRIYKTELHPYGLEGDLRLLYLATVDAEKTLKYLFESKRGQRIGKRGHEDFFYHGETTWGMSIDSSYSLLSLMALQSPEVLRKNRGSVLAFVSKHAKHYASPRKVEYKSNPVYLKWQDYDVRNGALDVLGLLGTSEEVKIVENVIHDAPQIDPKRLNGGPRDRREQIQQKGIRVIEQTR